MLEPRDVQWYEFNITWVVTLDHDEGVTKRRRNSIPISPTCLNFTTDTMLEMIFLPLAPYLLSH